MINRASSKVTHFSTLHELMLLEDFKKCLPECIVLYLNEQKITTLAAAAVLADESALTNKNVFTSVRADKGPPVVVPSPLVQAKMTNEQPKER